MGSTAPRGEGRCRYRARMTAILVTGMSGTGKSSALAELGRRGFRVVDTDWPGWSVWTPATGDDDGEWRWREDRMTELLSGVGEDTLYVSGCTSSQVAFYDRFDAIVLLTATADVILDRIATRTTNTYGKTPEERDQILYHLRTVEPLLRAGCTHEIDASRPLGEVVDALVHIGRHVVA